MSPERSGEKMVRALWNSSFQSLRRQIRQALTGSVGRGGRQERRGDRCKKRGKLSKKKKNKTELLIKTNRGRGGREAKQKGGLPRKTEKLRGGSYTTNLRG